MNAETIPTDRLRTVSMFGNCYSIIKFSELQNPRKSLINEIKAAPNPFRARELGQWTINKNNKKLHLTACMKQISFFEMEMKMRVFLYRVQ